MLLIYVIVAATIPPLFYAPTPGVLAVCAFFFGIGLGGDYMIIPLMAADLYGVAIMGRVMGVVLTADSVSEALVADAGRHPCAIKPGATPSGFSSWLPLQLPAPSQSACCQAGRERQLPRQRSDHLPFEERSQACLSVRRA